MIHPPKRKLIEPLIFFLLIKKKPPIIHTQKVYHVWVNTAWKKTFIPVSLWRKIDPDIPHVWPRKRK
jgi:hypothetical protein